MPFPVYLSVVCREVPRHRDTALIARLTMADPTYLRAAKALCEARRDWHAARWRFRFGDAVAAALAWQ